MDRDSSTVGLSPSSGGDEENRTLNPRLAKAVLCQLSYVPWRSGSATKRGTDTIMRAENIGP